MFSKISQYSLENTRIGVSFYVFIKKRLQNRCSLVNIAKSFGRHILKTICELLLLAIPEQCRAPTENYVAFLTNLQGSFCQQAILSILLTRDHFLNEWSVEAKENIV